MEETVKSSETYKSEKLPFVAFLLVTGKCELAGTESTPSSRIVTFLLSRQPTKEDIEAYFSGEGCVSARRFSETLTNLKGIAWEAKRLSAEGANT